MDNMGSNSFYGFKRTIRKTRAEIAMEAIVEELAKWSELNKIDEPKEQTAKNFKFTDISDAKCERKDSSTDPVKVW